MNIFLWWIAGSNDERYIKMHKRAESEHEGFLQNAYIHPVFKSEDDSKNDAPAQEFEKEPAVVLTKCSSRRNTPRPANIAVLHQYQYPRTIFRR
ncbi:hypothetical protein C1H46_012877 [Malus baccata]|uniref:Uncharacterized protein n=1 Tax=Malus baccata TaxID=106549 RepID=A0A540MRV8_MALBA|nr:hypothetical protein C1H46_012877 [Malus baccata]